MKTRNLLFSGLATVSVITGGIFSGVYSSSHALDASPATSIHSTTTTDSGSTTSTKTNSSTSSSGSTGSTGSTGSSSSSGASSSSSSKSSSTSSFSSGTYTGSAYNTRYGAVQVSVTIANGKITDVTTLASPDNDGRSMMISQRAIPTLRSQALSAQSANIQGVSGATYTSEGYAASLQSALDKANF